MAKSRRRKIDPRHAPSGFEPDPRIGPLRVAVTCEKASLVEEDIAASFAAAGHQVMVLPYRRSGPTLLFEEPNAHPGQLADRLMKFGPHLIVTTNLLGIGFGGLFPGIAEAEGIPLAAWLVDQPPARMEEILPPASAYSLVLTYDASHVESLRAMGYQHVYHLPLGVNTTRFPYVPEPDEGPPVSVGYVGKLFTDLVSKMRGYLGERARHYPPEDIATLENLFREGVEAFSQPGTPTQTASQWLETEGPPRFENPGATLAPVRDFLASAITHAAAGESRRRILRNLKGLNPQVWGDGWEDVFPVDQCHGRVPYAEVHQVYHQCRVNLSISHVQNLDSVTQRLFDVPACGRFVLSDWRPSMANLFEPGGELITFDSDGEARELAERYATDHAARRAVIERARARVLSEHTYLHRVEAITKICSEAWPTALERPRRRRTISIASPPVLAVGLLGQVATAMSEAGLERSTETIRETVESLPEGKAVATRLQADHALSQGRFSEARDLYRKALDEGDAAFDQTWFNAARATVQAEGPEAAEPFFRQAIARNPNHAGYWAALAACYLQMQKWPFARTALDTALRFDPSLPNVHQLSRAFAQELAGVEALPLPPLSS